jgi:hypothetical protein
MHASNSLYVPVTFDQCSHLRGPFYHGTKFSFEVGEEQTWEGHATEVLTGMLDPLTLLRQRGLDVIED